MLTVRTGWAARILRWAKGDQASPGHVRLTGSQVQRLRRAGQKVTVLEGSAWLTMAGYDHILERGATIGLGTSREAALISAVTGRPVRIEVG